MSQFHEQSLTNEGRYRAARAAKNNNNDKQGKIGLLSLWAVGRLSFAIYTQL